MRGAAPWWWVVLIALGCVACGHTRYLRASVTEPAGIPVRAFPHVWIDRGELIAEQEIASSLAAYLRATPNLDVRLVSVDELAAAQAGGTVPSATVLVKFRLHTRELSRVEWTTRPETVCDALGCFTMTRSYNYDVPVMEGELRISIQDAAQGQEQQRAVLRAREEGRRYDDMLPRIVSSLATRLQQLTEQRVSPVMVTWLEVDVPEVVQALRWAEAADWVRARAVLEALVATDAFAGMQADERARVWYDLAQSQRFDLTGSQPSDAGLQRARQSAQTAMEVHSDRRYAALLAEIENDLKRRRMVEDQRAAATHNFAVGARAGNASPAAAAPPATDATTRTP